MTDQSQHIESTTILTRAWRVDDVFKLAIAAAILAAGLGIAYHYVIYLPGKDREAAERARQAELEHQKDLADKQEAAEKRTQARNAAYRICLSNAQENYSSRWDSTCRDNAAEAASKRSSCVTSGYDPASCARMYEIPPAANCQLPGSLAESYDAGLKEARRQCLDEAKVDVARFSE